MKADNAQGSLLDSRTFRFILLISFAHALVHVFELSLSGVEQIVGDEFNRGKQWTGMLGSAFRLPFGLGALAAGFLADRYGPRRLLCVYLFGSMAVSLAMPFARTESQVLLAMISLGCFASIYHPAGLSLLSQITTPENRGRALGLHGVFGSLGIAGAPLVAGLFLAFASGLWRNYYIVLAIPAALAGALLWRTRFETNKQQPSQAINDEPVRMEWKRYLTAVSASGCAGVVYGAFLHFLPRYLDKVDLPGSIPPESARNYLTAVALFCGMAGQWIAGRIAKPGRLEIQFCCILIGNAPFLFWMAFADGYWRLLAACCLALVHFMNQPVYNSLLATLVPARNRSVGYGFSNMIGFGLGAFGPLIAGYMQTDRETYLLFGSLSLFAALMSVPLILTRKKISSP